MSTTVDQRVVQMKFDNKDFEKNVSTSMSTLEKFQNSLKFTGASKGIDEINKAAGRFSLSGMGDQVNGIGAKFDAMQIAAITAISKITSSAMDAGVKLAKSLSVDQITAGWQKYGQKTTSVATLVSQGYDMAEVEEQLARLNWYTDETSYNFTDMVSNIAKFTASGQDLEDSVTAMMGIANWAALSGQNATTASRAMYQLSQAMGKGFLKYDDWKSIQNASMDTVEFRQHAIDAAVALGELYEVSDGLWSMYGAEGGGFTMQELFTSDQLTKGLWFTSDVMMEVFKEYAGAIDQIRDYTLENEGVTASEAIDLMGDSLDSFQLKAFKSAQEARTLADAIDAVKDAVSTGWMNTFELIFGNYQEATRFFTDLANALYDVFAISGETRNELLEEGLKNSSGWRMFLGENILDEEIYISKIKEIAREHGIAIDEMIMEYGMFQDTLEEGWLDGSILADLFLPGGKALEDYAEAELAAIGYTQEEADAVKALGRTFIDSGIAVEDWVEIISQLSGRQNLVLAFWNAWEGIGNVVGSVKDALMSVIPEVTGDTIFELTWHIRWMTEAFQFSEEAVEGLKNVLSFLVSPLKYVISFAGFILNIVESLALKLHDLIDSFFSVFSDMSSLETVMQKIFGEERYTRVIIAWEKIIANLGDAVDVLRSKFKALGDRFNASDKIQSVLKNLSDILEPIANWILDRIVDGLETIAEIDFVAIINAVESKMVELGFTFENLETTVTDIYTGVKDFFADLAQKGPKAVIRELIDDIKELINLIFPAKEQVSEPKVAFNITEYLTNLRGSLDNIYPILEKVKQELLNFMNLLSPARILVFAFGLSITKLFLSASGLFDGLTKTTKAFTELTETFNKRLKPNPLLRIASAIAIMTGALLVLSFVDPSRLTKSIEAVAIMAALLVGMMGVITILEKTLLKTRQDAVKFQRISIGILAIAGSLLAMSVALKIISTVDTKHMISQLVSFAVVLAELVGALFLINLINPTLTKANFFLLSLAGSMLLLVLSLKSLSSIRLNEVRDGISALTMITTLAAILSMATKVTGFKNTAGMLTFALGIIAMVAAIKVVERIDIAEMLETLPQLISIVLLMIPLGIAANKAGEHAVKAGLGIALMTLGIIALSVAVKRIGELELGQAIKGVIGVIALVVTLNETLSGVKEATKNMMSAGVGLLFLSGAIVILSFAIKAIGKLNLAEAAIGTGAVSVILGMVALILYVSKDIEKSAGTMIALAVTVGILSTALMLLTLLPIKASLGAAAALSMVMLALAGATKLIEGFDVKKLITVILFMTILFAEIIAAFSIGRDFDEMKIIAIAGAISLIALALAGTLYIIGSIPKFRKLKLESFLSSLAAMGIIIGSLTVLMGIIGTADKFLGGIVSKGVEVMSTFWTVGGILAEALVLVLFIGAGAVLLKKYGNGVENNLETFLPVLEAIGIVLLSITALSFIIGVIDKNLDGVISHGIEVFSKFAELIGVLAEMIGFITLVGGLAFGLNKLGGQNFNSLKTFLPVLEAIGTVLGVLIILTGALGTFDKYFEGYIGNGIEILHKFATLWDILGEMLALVTLIGFISYALNKFASGQEDAILMTTLKIIGIMELVIISIAGIVAGLGWFLSNEDSMNVINNGVVAFRKLGEAIGAFFGGIVGGAVGGFEASKYDQISGSADNIASFIEKIQKIGALDESVTSSLKDLADAMVTFSIVRVDQIDFDGISNALDTFAPSLVKFSQSLDGVSFENTSAAVQAAAAINEITDALPRSGGLKQSIMGTPEDLKTFADAVAVLGPAMATFYTDTKDIKKDLFDTSVTMGKSLAALETKLPKTGGKLQEWIGEENMTLFSDGIVRFGQAMVAFNTLLTVDKEGNLRNIDFKSLENAAKIGESLAKMDAALPQTGGKLQDWLGSKNLDSFSGSLENFGDGIVAYYNSLSELNTDTFNADIMEKATEAGKNLAELNKIIPTTDGFMGKIFGEASLGAFGENLKGFGEGMQQYYYKIGGINVEKFGASLSLAQTLVDISKSIDDYGGIEKMFQTTNMDIFSKSLNNFGGGLKTFYSKIFELDWEVTNIAITSIARLVKLVEGMSQINETDAAMFGIALYDLSKAGISGFLSAFSESESVFKEKGIDIITKIKDGITTQFISLNSAGGTIVTKIFEGFDSKCNSLANAKGSSLIDYIKTGLTSKNGSLFAAGASIVDQFMSGMTNKQQTITAQAGVVGNNVYNAFMTALNIVENYSSKFIKIGEYITSGIVRGMTGNESSAIIKKSGNSVVSKIMTSLKNAADIHSPAKLPEEEVGVPMGQGTIKGLVETIDGSTDEVAGSLMGLFDELGSIVSDSFDPIKSQVTDAVGGVIEDAKSTVSDAFSPVKEKVTDIVGDVVDGAKEKASGLLDLVPDEFKEILPDSMTESVAGMIDTLTNGTGEIEDLLPDSMNDSVTEMINMLNSSTETLPTTFENLGGNSVIQLSDGMLEQLGFATDSAFTVTSAISDAYNSGLSGISSTTYTPTITPVYDLDSETELPDLDATGAWTWTADEETLNAISGWTEKDSERLDTIIQALNHVNGNIADSTTALYNNQKQLVAYLEQQLPKMEEKDVILDDGTLVGKLMPRINTEFGILAERERRQ